MTEARAIQADEQAVRAVIETQGIQTLFQPVVSISTKSIIGFEAYSRGMLDEQPVSPDILFHQDLSPETKLELDRLCRASALNKFKQIAAHHDDMLLFLKMNADVLEHAPPNSDHLKSQTENVDLDYGRIVIQVYLNRASSQHYMAFKEQYKEYGYHICLEGCKTDDTFARTMLDVEPDYVKIMPAFFNSERCELSTRAFEMILGIANRLGTMVIGQGVESEEDSIRLLSAGVHLQQGYYYTKDETARPSDPASFFKKIEETYMKFKTTNRQRVKDRKERLDNVFKRVQAVCNKLSNCDGPGLESTCPELARGAEAISIFILNEAGIQITGRSHVKPAKGKERTVKSLGSSKGVDHSMHDYFTYVDLGYEKFVTKPFVSQLTGATACIIAKPFFNYAGKRYIACLEMPYPN